MANEISESVRLTPSLKAQLEALAIGPVLPQAFAARYFPRNHPGWKRHTTCGRGVRHGGGLVLWAGGALGKLRKQGLAVLNGDHTTSITAKGRELLAAR